MREGKVTVREAGSRGGKARAIAQTEAERSASASRAAKARWAKWRERKNAEQALFLAKIRGS